MNSNQDLTVQCGKPDDDFDVLKVICENEAQKLCKKLTIIPGSSIIVPFWTKGFPELIGVGRFSKDGKGNISFVLDYSESTL